MPERIQLSRKAGWRKPEGAIVVSRPTRWGNMFKVGELIVDPGRWQRPASPYDGVMQPGTYKAHNILDEPYDYEIRPVRDRAEAVSLFRAFVEFHDDDWPPDMIRSALGGKDLCCWCPLPEPGEPDHCHGAVLLELARVKANA